jgi:hypothetical protein
MRDHRESLDVFGAVIAEISSLVAAGGPRHECARRVASLVRRLAAFSYAAIFDVSAGRLQLLACDAEAASEPGGARTEVLGHAAIACGRTIAASSVAARALLDRTPHQADIVVPIRSAVDERLCGLLGAGRDELARFGDDDHDLLEACAAVLGLLWE